MSITKPQDNQTATGSLHPINGYWIKKLEGIEELQLPKYPSKSLKKAKENNSHSFFLDRALLDNLSVFFENTASPPLILVAALKVLLYRYSGKNDFCIGNTIKKSGPFSPNRETEQNDFLDILPIRSKIDGSMQFGEFVQKLGADLAEANSYNQISLDHLISALGIKNEKDLNILFPVIFDYHKNFDPEFPSLSSQINLESFFSPLHFGVVENGDTIEATITFDPEIYCPKTIQKMASHFFTLLESVQSDPTYTLGHLNIIPKEEEDLLLKSFNDTICPLPDRKTILDLFEQQVVNNPNALAVEFEGNRLSYKELDIISNQVAHYLTKNGLKPEIAVPICIDRSLEMVAGIFGILKSRGAFVPIDPALPKDRIDYMVEDTKADFVICSSKTLKNFGDEIRHIIMDREMVAILSMPSDELSDLPSPENLAYIIYTSGSTGRPKGVMIEHRNLVNFLLSMSKNVEVDALSSILSVTTQSFDIFYLELFLPLVNGGKVFLAGREVAMDGFSLFKKLEEVRPTHMQATPSGWQMLLNSGWNNPQNIKMLVGGEALGEELKNTLVGLGTLWNMYGPTETTIWSTFKKMEAGEKVSIGKPIDNTSVYILSGDGSLNPMGIPGELCIGGKGVGRGYLNKPDLTSQKFLPNPFSNIPGDRIYRTGDLARWLPEGNIEYLGRMDDQVKIRGYRIELGEIESVLLLHPTVKQAVVLAREYGQADKRLVGYVVCKGDFDKESVSEFLRSKLPEYMVPAFWLQLEKLPLTFSGKIDRKALPDVGTADMVTAGYAEPRNDLEKQLAALWQKLLGLDSVGIHDDFFALGGHSLLAMRTLAAIRKDLGAELSIRELFSAPTVAQLALILQSRSGLVSSNVPHPVARPENIPLSYNQQSLWFIHQLEGSIQYHIPLILRIKGKIYFKALEDAFKIILNRHESLRTLIKEKDGVYSQIIQGIDLWNLERMEFTDKKQLKNEITKLIRIPFDLTKDYMLKACLITTDQNDHRLVITMHHIASDGWSTNILRKEILESYQSLAKGKRVTLSPLPIQYTDYALWQRSFLNSDAIQNKIDYWKAKLQNVSTLELPTDFSRPPIQSNNGNSHRFSIDNSLVSQLRELGQNHQSTLFMTLLAAFKTLLYRYSGQEDICIGTPVAGRESVETDDLIGFFVNTLGIRSNLNGNKTYINLLKDIRSTTLEAFEFQQVPFEMVVGSLGKERDLSRNPVFQVLFVLQNVPKKAVHLENIVVSEEVYEHFTSKFDITFELTEVNSGVEGIVEYNTDLYLSETIERLVSHYIQLLKSILENPSLKLDQFNIIPSDERTYLLDTLNATKVSYRHAMTPVDLFEEWVNKKCEAVALKFNDTELSYQEVHEWSNQLAHYLITEHGLVKGDLVGIKIKRSIQMVVSVLGVLKAGAAYVPIDIDYPKERIAYMEKDSGYKVLLDVNEWDTFTLKRSHYSIVKPKVVIGLTDAMYVIYTSGSTGNPKGCVLNYEGVNNYLDWTSEYSKDFSYNEVDLFSSLSFDFTVTSLFGALTQGKALRIYNQSEDLLSQLNEIVLNPESGWIKLTPSHISLIEVQTLKKARPKVFVIGGEALTKDQIKHLRNNLGCRIYNEYGPTEATVGCIVKEISDDNEPYIGSPIQNTETYLLDSNQRLLPFGSIGEICIGGVGLARGYLNREDLTKEKFIENPYKPGGRLYRTGDMGRWREDGNLEYLGRIDDQVKIRGYRIELGEIEHALTSYQEAGQCVVIARALKNTTEKELIAYCTGDVSSEELKAYLNVKLPQYMVPNYFVKLEKIPLTSNGKIDRKALPDVGIANMVTAGYTEPRNDLEKQLAALWQKLLGLDKVGIHDDFFALGGNSLLAMRNAAAVRKELGAELSIRELFSAPTVAELALILESRGGEQSSPVPHPVARPESIPLSYNQQSLWFIHQLEGSIQYHIPLIFNIKGKLNIDALEDAFKTVVNRHEALRTVIWEKDGTYCQTLLGKDLWKLDRMELPDPLLFKNEITRLIRIPFDLAGDHMMRACLITKAKGDYCLVITMHHIASDGWSSNILKRELMDSYHAIVNATEPSLPPLPIQYIDYALWQRNYLNRDSIRNKIDYWKAKLQNVSPLQLPTDFARPPIQNTRGDSYRFSIDHSIVSPLRELGQSHQSTLFMTLLAAFKTLLYRYSGQEDICIGTPTAGRESRETEDLIGLFVNTLALRSSLRPNMPFSELLKEIRATTLESFEFQQIPFEMVVESLGQERDLSRNPVFQVLFVLQNVPKQEIYLENTSVSEESFEHFTSKFDMTFELTEAESGIEGIVEYNTDLYRPESIERFVRHFVNLLKSVLKNPSLEVGSLKILSNEEELTLTESFNSTTQDPPYQRTVLDLFEEQVEKSPEAIAAEFEGKKLTYRELNKRSNQLANYLLKKNIQPESLVPICLDRSLEMIIGILGILKAGGAYVPVDPTYPDERIEFVFSDTRANFIITTSDLKTKLQNRGELIIIDEDWPEIEKLPEKPIPLDILKNQLAYIIYTSGSTGKPKGVMIEHGGLMASTMARQSYYKESGAVLLIPSFAFDSSVAVIFGTLTTGGKLILCKSELIKNPHHIKELLRETETILCVPSYYRFLLEEDLLAKATLSNVIVAGENLDESLVKLHFEKSGNASLYNEYGPTECTVWASVAKIQSPSEKVTIGKPIDYLNIFIISKDNQLNPINVTGELCIGGQTLSRGYLNLPDLTSEKFVNNPFSTVKGAKMYRTGDLARWLPDGNIEYLGRIDDQVKIRGYRIELGEIESTINSLEGVKESAVILREDLPGQKQLVGYVVCQKPLQTISRETWVYQIKERLHEILPNYMVPSKIILLEHLPLTANNKIDKKNLPKPLENISEKKSPTTNLEKTISKIWCSALKKDEIDIMADFFELGGHSLLAVKIITALEKEIGSKIAINQIFKHPNILELAKALENINQNQTGWNSLVPIKPSGNKPPLYIVHGVGSTVSIYYNLAKYIEDDRPIYGFQPKGLDGIETPNKSLEEMASYYISLMIHQNPYGPYNISGYSFGGYVAYEMARQLRSMGKQVGKLILFDTSSLDSYEKFSAFDKIKLRSKIILNEINFVLHEPQGYFEKKSRSFQRKRDKLLVKMKLKPDPKYLADSKSVLKRVAKNNADILRKYKLVPHQGPMYLFRANTQSSYIEEPKYYGWVPFVEKVHVVHVSGHHDNIFHKPEILKDMAEKIQKVLDENPGS